MSSFNFKDAFISMFVRHCDSSDKHQPSPWDVPPVSPLRTLKVQQTSLSTHANRRLKSAGCRRDHSRSVDTTPAAWKSSAASRWWTTWAERQHSPCVRSPGIYPPLYGIRTSSTMVNSTPVKAAVRTQVWFPEAFQSKLQYSSETGGARVLILKKNKMLDLNGDMNTIKA